MTDGVSLIQESTIKDSGMQRYADGTIFTYFMPRKNTCPSVGVIIGRSVYKADIKSASVVSWSFRREDIQWRHLTVLTYVVSGLLIVCSVCGRTALGVLDIKEACSTRICAVIIGRHRHRHRHRQTGRQKDRHTAGHRHHISHTT